MKERGFFVADRTHPDHGSTMRDAMDPRVLIPDLGLRHRNLIVFKEPR